MAIVHLVRHGRASAGWDTDPDPGLDELGAAQAEALADRMSGPRPIVTSPLRRCRETADALARRWDVVPDVEPLVAEMPSPEGVAMGERVAWLRAAMATTWTALGPRYVDYRDAVVARVASTGSDTVITSHFIAINAVIGGCIGDDRVVLASLDNCSVTVVETAPGRGRAGLRLIETGHEADTLIR
ncbi:MAG: histidine phosphatase family protein [Ilumatobacteraceae bacterium]